MFHYTICDAYARDIFKKQCNALESNIPNLKKELDIEDVDSTQTRIYQLGNKSITVKNSYPIGAVYIDAEIDIMPFFRK